MANELKLYRGSSDALGNITPERGAFYFCEDTGDFYVGASRTSSDTGEITLVQVNKNMTYSKDFLNQEFRNIQLSKIDVSDFYNGHFNITTEEDLNEGIPSKKIEYQISHNLNSATPTTSITSNGKNVTIQWGSSSGQKELIDIIYPVGSIYMSFSPNSPSMLFGGSWEQLKKTFLYAAYDGGGVPSGSTGGEEKHLLTIDEMPSHQHDIYSGWGEEIDDYSTDRYRFQRWGLNDTGWHGGNLGTSYRGNGVAHNNMPPYTACYIWKRVS